jgi:hypothetical protein
MVQATYKDRNQLADFYMIRGSHAMLMQRRGIAWKLSHVKVPFTSGIHRYPIVCDSNVPKFVDAVTITTCCRSPRFLDEPGYA